MESSSPIAIDALWNVDPRVLRRHVKSNDVDDAILESLARHLQDCTTVLEEEIEFRRRKDLYSDIVYPSLGEESAEGTTSKQSIQGNRSTIDTVSPSPPTEVLRQLTRIPGCFLTTKELGIFLLLTCKSFRHVLGEDYIWKQLCSSKWPESESILSFFIDNKDSTSEGYEALFRQLSRGTILQVPNRLSQNPIPSPRLSLARDKMAFMITVWDGFNRVVVAETFQSIGQILELFASGTVTIDLASPIVVGELPQNHCHCWNLPRSRAYAGWRATVHFFVRSKYRLNAGPNNNSLSWECFNILDSNFQWWRGWSKEGELTLLQRDQRSGLDISDMGKCLEHRIIRSSGYVLPTEARSSQHHPRGWPPGYLGLQFKIVLTCSQRQRPRRQGQQASRSNVIYDFQKLKLEAVRAHEKSDGSVQHYLFRKDEGWQQHGVELLHLMSELR